MANFIKDWRMQNWIDHKDNQPIYHQNDRKISKYSLQNNNNNNNNS